MWEWKQKIGLQEDILGKKTEVWADEKNIS